MKTKYLLATMMAILIVFAMLGCSDPDNSGQTTVSVRFIAYGDAVPLVFNIPENEALGNTRLGQVTALQAREEFEFKGWSLIEGGNAETITVNSKWNADTVYYGLWAALVAEGENITITYNLNDFPANQPADYTAKSGQAIGEGALPVLSAGEYIWRGWSLTVDGSPINAEAVFRSDTILYARYIVQGPPPPPPPPPPSFSMPYDLHPLRNAVPSDFIRGVDISNCLEIEQAGGAYRNFDGEIEDIMKILVDNGVNYVRVRLWVDPTKITHNGNVHYPGDGNNIMEVTKVIAARAKAAGMKFLLNYHYSDYWADPGQQYVPYIWRDKTTRLDLLDALYDYTVDTIAELTQAGAAPDMVQLGNEIRSGLLRQRGLAGTQEGYNNGYVLDGWGDFSLALQTASEAVRLAAPNAKIMIHFDNGGASNILGAFENFTRRIDNNRPATYTEVDYDVIGLSWYYLWTSHGSLDNLHSNIRTFKERFGKEVVVAESGSIWSVENWDQMGNYAGNAQLENVSAMNSPLGFADNSEIEIGYRTNGTTRYIVASPENQARITRATMDAILDAGGAGFMWWGADWIALNWTTAVRSNSEMAAIFESTLDQSTNGRALPALKVLGGIRGADVDKPGKITGIKADPDVTTVSISWTKVSGTIADRYQLERADSENGPWTVLSDNITEGTYQDTGLSGTYYYRVRGSNRNGWGNYSDTVEARTLPFVPTGLSITTTIDTAALTWTALTGAVRYEVSRAAIQAGPWTVLSDNVTTATYNDTGLTPAAGYYYRLRAFGTQWGDYGDTVLAETLPLPAVINFRINTADTSSITLGWNAINSGITGYEIYWANSETEPEDSGYALLNSPAVSATEYIHSGLSVGETYWYKIRAVFTTHGNGPWSAARSYTIGAAELTASIDMTTGTLDDDFLDPLKASSTDDALGAWNDSYTNYGITKLYVANDEVNLYIALEFGGRQPAAYDFDRLVVWVDNTNSTAGNANIGAMMIANTQTTDSTIEAVAYKRMNQNNPGGTDGVAINITAWTKAGNPEWTWKPTDPADEIIKFSIPLDRIGFAAAGDELKVMAAFSMGWDNAGDIRVSGLIPRSVSNASAQDVSITINMDNALSYTVK